MMALRDGRGVARAGWRTGVFAHLLAADVGARCVAGLSSVPTLRGWSSGFAVLLTMLVGGWRIAGPLAAGDHRRGRTISTLVPAGAPVWYWVSHRWHSIFTSVGIRVPSGDAPPAR
jgi:hypothetical protein